VVSPNYGPKRTVRLQGKKAETGSGDTLGPYEVGGGKKEMTLGGKLTTSANEYTGGREDNMSVGDRGVKKHARKA